MHAARSLIIALASLTLGSCATTGAAPRDELPDLHRAMTTSGSGNRISFTEISQERASSAYDLIERLRPYYLRGRTMGLFDEGGGPVVYLDDIMLGGVDNLRMISAHDIMEIRYVRGEEMRTHVMEASGRQVIQIISRRN